MVLNTDDKDLQLEKVFLIFQILSKLTSRKKAILEKLSKEMKQLSCEDRKNTIIKNLEKLKRSLKIQVQRQKELVGKLMKPNAIQSKELIQYLVHYRSCVDNHEKLIHDFEVHLTHLEEFLNEDD